MKLILASKSPRRKDILNEFGYDFKIMVSNEKEEIANGLKPFEVVKSLAYQKANSVFQKLENKDDVVVLGADTIVVFRDEILLKPKDSKNQTEMLKSLSNNSHFVYTGFCLISKDRQICDYDESVVLFNKLSDKTVFDYVDSKLGMDKAGGYGVQDGYPLVKKIDGSYYNVVGLPIEKIKGYLDELGF